MKSSGEIYDELIFIETTLGFLLIEEEPDKAKVLLTHAYATFLQQLGPQHPHTQQLARFFQENGEPE